MGDLAFLTVARDGNDCHVTPPPMIQGMVPDKKELIFDDTSIAIVEVQNINNKIFKNFLFL